MFPANLVCIRNISFLFTKFVIMKLLITSATKMELPILNSSKNVVDTCISGIGCAITMFHLQEALQNNNYDLVIQTGIAGSFDLKKNGLGKVVLAETDAFADLGVSESNDFRTLFELNFLAENSFPFTDGILVNNHTLLEKIELPSVKAITVNTVTDDRSKIKQLQSKFSADIETMEGAALHYICLQKKIPFLQIRSISNEVGERNKENWKIKEALENLNISLNKIIKELI